MNTTEANVGKAQAIYNAVGTRVLRYTLEMVHEGLKEHKIISAPEFDILENKAGVQLHKWEEKWRKIEEKRKTTEEKEANKDEAKTQTTEAIESLKELIAS